MQKALQHAGYFNFAKENLAFRYGSLVCTHSVGGFIVIGKLTADMAMIQKLVIRSLELASVSFTNPIVDFAIPTNPSKKLRQVHKKYEKPVKLMDYY